MARILRAQYWRGESYTKNEKVIQRATEDSECLGVQKLSEKGKRTTGKEKVYFMQGTFHVHTSRSGAPGRILRRVLSQ